MSQLAIACINVFLDVFFKKGTKISKLTIDFFACNVSSLTSSPLLFPFTWAARSASAVE